MLPIVDRTVPDDFAAGRVQRDKPRVEPGDNDEIARERHAATDRPATQHRVKDVDKFGLVMQEDIAGLRIDSEVAGVVGGEIEDAIVEERRGFEAAELAAG